MMVYERSEISRVNFCKFINQFQTETRDVDQEIWKDINNSI